MVRRDRDAPVSVDASEPAADTPAGFDTLSSPDAASTVNASGLGSAQMEMFSVLLTVETVEVVVSEPTRFVVVTFVPAADARAPGAGAGSAGALITSVVTGSVLSVVTRPGDVFVVLVVVTLGQTTIARCLASMSWVPVSSSLVVR